MYVQTDSGLRPRVPPIDLQRAILKNRIYARQLGWQSHYPEILRHLGFSRRPGEGSFTRAVANWQSSQEMKADGSIGPSAWKQMQAEIASPTTERTPVAARLDRFEHNRATLIDSHRREITQLVERIAESWQKGAPIMTVKVVGHTDPTGPPAHNQTLGLRRALAVRKELQQGLRRRKLFHKVLVLATSKGARERIDLTNTPEGNAKNRRVEVFLSTKKLRPIVKKNGKIEEKTIPWITERPAPGKPEDRPEKCNEEYFRSLVKECDSTRDSCRNKCMAKYAVGGFTDPSTYCPPVYPVDEYCQAKRKAAQERRRRERQQCERQCYEQLNACVSSMRQFTNCPTQSPRGVLFPFRSLVNRRR